MVRALGVGVCLDQVTLWVSTIFALLQGALDQGPGAEVGWER